MPPARATARPTEIADAVLRIAGREGIHALTMERLGREVGVTAGALFRHFPSRDAMLEQAAGRAVELLEGTFPDPALPPLERLQRFLSARASLAAEHGAIPQLVFSEQFAKALPEAGSRRLHAVVERSHGFVAEAVREAAARGEARADLPAAELATVVLGTLVGRALLGALLPPSSRPGRDDPWPTILTLLRPSSPDRRPPRSR